MNRKSFLKNTLLVGLGSLFLPLGLSADEPKTKEVKLSGVIKNKTFHIKSDEYVSIEGGSHISNCHFIVDNNGRDYNVTPFVFLKNNKSYFINNHVQLRGPYQVKTFKLLS